MRVRVIPFGVLKDWLGAAPATVELREGASVGELLEWLKVERLSARVAATSLSGIAVSVNADYARAEQILREGDEVGLLPPVSGGGPAQTGAARTGASRTADALDGGIDQPTVVALTRERIGTEKLIAEAKRGEDGAVVVFDGIVRNHSRGRQTLHLDYEAYEEMAEKQMRELAINARGRFGVRHVTMVHRLGRLEIGETSVLIVVASAHRTQAFEACRWLIDALKQTVPIWKKETFVDGAVWAPGEPFPEGMAVDGGAA
jgi:molybdopterin synthase catalytic subunit/molybdopterin converting factor small subunit